MTDDNDSSASFFAVPTLLARSFSLGTPDGASLRAMTAIVNDIDVTVNRFGFPDQRERDAAAANLVAAALAEGHRLVPIACSLDGSACDLYVWDNPDVTVKSSDDTEGREVFAAMKSSVDVDVRHLEHFSRLAGLKMIYDCSYGLVQPPHPSQPDTVCLFTHARPPGKFHSGVDVRLMFGLKVWKDGETRIVNCPTRGRGRVIEHGGMSLFQVLGRNYYQLCLTWSDNHDFDNRERIFIKLMGLLYGDLLERDGAASVAPEATSGELTQFGFRQADRTVAESRLELGKTDAEIQRVEKELAELVRKREKLVRNVKALTASDYLCELFGRLPDECAGLKAIKGVAAVRLVDGAVHIETEPIVLRHAGRSYDLGPFVIRLDEKDGVSVWSEVPRHPDGHHHPHVDRVSLACFGNVTLAINKCMAALRFADATRLVIRWLNTYNPDTTLIPIEGWAAYSSSADVGEKG